MTTAPKSPSIGDCCQDLAHVLNDDTARPTVRHELAMSSDGDIRGVRLAWHIRRGRRRGFRWLSFCPFCGAALPVERGDD